MSKRPTLEDVLGRSFLHPPRSTFDQRVQQAQRALLGGDCHRAQAIVATPLLVHTKTSQEDATMRRLRRALTKCKPGLGNAEDQTNVIGERQGVFDQALWKAVKRLAVRDCDGAQAYAATVQLKARSRNQIKRSLLLQHAIGSCRRGEPL